MSVGLLGRKIGMTQVYNEAGDITPVTVIQAGPCVVLQVRTLDAMATKLCKSGLMTSPGGWLGSRRRGHVAAIKSKRSKARAAAGVEVPAKADCEPKRFVREFRTDGEGCDCEVGQELTVDLFADVSNVDVIAASKGRGTAGVMKRHNFAGQRASHGVKRVHRHPGSIGQSADPARVIKGTRMAGGYGNARITVRNLELTRVDEENGLLLVAGSVPGPKGGYVMIRKTNKLG